MDTDKEYHFSASRLESELSGLPARGITRLIINDPEITGQKKSFLKFINMARQAAPDIFYTFYIQPDIIDTNVCRELEGLYFALQIHLPATVDKKHLKSIVGKINTKSLGPFGRSFYNHYSYIQNDVCHITTPRTKIFNKPGKQINSAILN